MSTMQFEIEAHTRESIGKGDARRLRKQEKIPAVLYGAGEKPQGLVLDHESIIRNLKNEAFYSHILTLKLNGDSFKVVLKDLQRHPQKPRILHLDLLRVSDKEKIRMQIPLHFVGAENSPAIKVSKGLITHLMTSVEIACFAKDLPEFLEVNLENLKEGETLHLSDVPLPPGTELPALLAGHNSAIASVHIPRSSGDDETPAGAQAAAAVTPGGAT